MVLRKTVILIIVIVLTILTLVGLLRQIKSAIDASQRLDLAAEEVARLQDKNQKLRKKLVELQNPDFVEEVARDKLNLAKPNETVVIISQEAVNKILGESRKLEEVRLPNWQGWLRLFLH